MGSIFCVVYKTKYRGPLINLSFYFTLYDANWLSPHWEGPDGLVRQLTYPRGGAELYYQCLFLLRPFFNTALATKRRRGERALFSNNGQLSIHPSIYLSIHLSLDVELGHNLKKMGFLKEIKTNEGSDKEIFLIIS